MKKFFFIFFFLLSCSSNQNKISNNYSNIDFNEDLTFEQFKTKLEEYAINSPYPNIDN
tara:strand:- start:794 stop:967 length:174 start_codon:yes stop_codon:yes gene_type:complete